jgi:CRP/FNR family transcriptional regulator
MTRPSGLLKPPQRRILGLLLEMEIAGQALPTYGEICAALGWRAPGTARSHVRSLVRKGFVSVSRRPRGLLLTDAGREMARGGSDEASPFKGSSSLSSEAAKAFASLAPYLRARRFPAGTVLWREGEPASMVVVIDTGRVKICRTLSNGKTVTLLLFGPGEMFGFLPFIDGGPYPANAEAVDDVEARTISRDGLLSALRDNPDLAMTLLSFLGRRLREAFNKIEFLSERGALPRVAAALAALPQKGEGAGTTILSLQMPSGEFARGLGITPESFSRAITDLVETGVIHRVGRGRFQVLDLQSLRKIGSPPKL